MKSHTKILPLSIFLIMITSVFQVQAADSGNSLLTPVTPTDLKNSNYPGPYKRSGTVSSRDGTERSIVISGQKYYYGINTKVHTPQSDFSSILTLASGTSVGVNYTEDAEGRHLLYEIWILPPALPGIPTIADH